MMREWMDGLNSYSGAWSTLAVAVVWQSTLVALVVAAAARALRRSSPALRYWLWQIVAIKLLVMPLWSVTLSVAWPVPALVSLPHIENSGLGVANDLPAGPATSHAASVTAAPGSPTSTVSNPTTWRLNELTWGAWLLVGWSLVVGLQLFQIAIQRRRLSRLLRAATPAGAELIATIDSVARNLHLARPISVLVTHENCSPFVHGVFRPSLVLPQALLAVLSAAELRHVLSHELAHVKRRDLAWGWIPQITRMLYFFHPIAHWCYRSIRLERELACDQLAIAVGSDKPGDYVQTLVRVVSHISQPPSLQNAVAMLAVEGAWPGERSASGPTPARHERPLP